MNSRHGSLACWKLLAAITTAVSSTTIPAGAALSDWVSLFDGRSLSGWRSNEDGASFRVADGAIICDGPRSHLFFVGADGNAAFGDFEFEAEVKTRPGANSGIYFDTAYQQTGWPLQGYEVQVNNTASGEGGYRENKKTGSLYGIRNIYRQLVPDDGWFSLRIAVRGRRVVIHVNDVLAVDYVEPDNPPNAGYAGRRLGPGTFALQCHDPGSRAFFRRLRVRPLPAATSRGEQDPAYVIPTMLATLHAENYPVVDLHTHLKGGLTVDDVLRRQYQTGINAGIAINCGLGFAVTNDATLDAALAGLRHPLVFTGMQAEGREWTRLFTPGAVAKFDYVFTDAMTLTDDQGRRMRLWIPSEVQVGDPGEFMDMLVRRTVRILEDEPIDIWVNPTYLPEALAMDYDRLWTPERMDRVIDAAVRHGVAIEINDRFRLPSAAFIGRAKKAGAKFTFGTNNGGREDLGRLEYPAAIVAECGLKWDDFWLPGARPGRAQAGTR